MSQLRKVMRQVEHDAYKSDKNYVCRVQPKTVTRSVKQLDGTSKKEVLPVFDKYGKQKDKAREMTKLPSYASRSMFYGPAYGSSSRKRPRPHKNINMSLDNGSRVYRSEVLNKTAMTLIKEGRGKEIFDPKLPYNKVLPEFKKTILQRNTNTATKGYNKIFYSTKILKELERISHLSNIDIAFRSKEYYFLERYDKISFDKRFPKNI